MAHDSKPVNPRRHSSRRISALAAIIGAESYLEVGVAAGATFRYVNIRRKHAVDRRFKFDYKELETDAVKFFEMTSDEYFTSCVEPSERFDIVFLDGLHTFEQTFRDFCASLMHSHDNTIWLFDDVFPTDIFSAHRNPVAARKHRHLHGGEGSRWHGDVFKVIFALHDFFPNMSYKTINTRGNPQTVLLKRPRSSFKPLYNDLERISRMSYYDFYENQDVLQLEPEEGVLAWVGELLETADSQSGAVPGRSQAS